MNYIILRTYLKVSKIMVNNTNFPNKGTTNDVGGIISANSKKNTVSDSNIEILKLTYKKYKIPLGINIYPLFFFLSIS